MIIGERVRLRPLEPEDAEKVWEWENDPEVRRWFENEYHESLAQVSKRFEERAVNSYEEVTFGIETIADAELIGVVDLTDTSPESGQAELEIYIGEKDRWGNGYGTDAARTLCRYGFDVLRLHQIMLWVVAENEAARQLYRKIGFQEEGRQRQTFRLDGQWHDSILMGMLEGELT